MKSVEDMVRLNLEQAEFYDTIHEAEARDGRSGYSRNRSANFVTRLWAAMRQRQLAAVRQGGVEAVMLAAHERWIQRKSGGTFLELGCFSGSPSTVALAQASGSYLGIDLSERAVASLNQKFGAMGLSSKARAKSADILTFDETPSFDLIYAHGVLHHFENPAPLFAKLARLCRPNGYLLFVDPSAVNPCYRTLRAAYRPFQTDARWEWPFRAETVRELERNFVPVEGFGWGRHSLPLSVMTGAPLVGGLLAQIYTATIRREVAKGWHGKVWLNSMVTALYQRRD